MTRGYSSVDIMWLTALRRRDRESVKTKKLLEHYLTQSVLVSDDKYTQVAGYSNHALNGLNMIHCDDRLR